MAEKAAQNITEELSIGRPGNQISISSRWGNATFELLHQLWNDPDSLGPELSELSEAVSLCPAYFFGNDYNADEDEGWKRTVMGFRKMDQRDVARFRAMGGTDKYVIKERI